MNLEKFSAQIYAHYDEGALESFRSWEKALSYIDERQREVLLVDIGNLFENDGLW